ncbi:MAG: ABC transporter substrate-binding protein [Syntrophales bacterium]|nr:ABC transporter substrate-binding protein [Syntrophales bacterium]
MKIKKLNILLAGLFIVWLNVMCFGGYVEAGTISPELDKLRQQMGIPTGPAAGQGLKIPIGVSLPMSGGAEEFAGPMSQGVKLGLKLVKDMGGPEFIPTFYDIQMGVAELGVNAITDMGSKKIGMALVGWTFYAGAQIPGAQKYKILLLDAGGGTGADRKGQDFCWGTRMDNNQMEIGGAVMYAVKTHPEFKTVMTIGQDYGPEHQKIVMTAAQKHLDAVNKALGTNITYLGDERTPSNMTDYSSIIAKINSKNPDVLLMLPFDGNAPILFMKQITRGQPIKAMCIGADWSLDSFKTAGRAWKDYYYAGQEFFPEMIVNPFGKYFYKTYKETWKEEPNFFAAGFFQDCFTLWDLVRRVIAKGGDYTNGEELQAALKADPKYQAVYGGDENTVGYVHWDVDTHDPTDLEMYVCITDMKKAKLVPLASFGNYATNFKMLKK